MLGDEVTLSDMLKCREDRAAEQSALIRQFDRPVVSFCMNIPGPVKTNTEIRHAFEVGRDELREKLNDAEIPVLFCEERHAATGDELMLCADAPAEKIKEIAIDIEDHHPCGRLYDMDVIRTDGTKCSRHGFRTCIVCGGKAQDCARSRRHSIREMQDAVEEILQRASMDTDMAEEAESVLI